jgi:hypothetical protein
VPFSHFLRYHFLLAGWREDSPWWRNLLSFRPRIRYESIDGFDDVIGGDTRALFNRASRAADARRVEFI